MNIFEILLKIDRRIIYLILLFVVVLPLLFPTPEKVRVMLPVEKLYDVIDNIPDDKALIIDFVYTPQLKPELEPMAFAILRHAFKRRIKVLALSLYAEPLGLAQKALREVTEEFNNEANIHEDSIIYGRDYVFLGWQPPPLIPMLGMGESITNVYKTDYYGNKTDTLPLMQYIRNYNDVALLVSIAGSRVPIYWVSYAQNRFGLKVGVGCTAVSAADFYAYYQTGQFSGLMVGMKGAAEYEELVEKRLGVKGRKKASEALPSLTYAHLVMIAFITIGNIGFFMKRKQR